MEYILTEKGRENVAWFIKECKAKRKEILDADWTLPMIQICQQKKIFDWRY